MSKPSVLILGGTSDIGQAIAHTFASRGFAVVLAARESARLEATAADLAIRHDTPVSVLECDATDPEAAVRLFEELPALPDVAVCVVGTMPDQSASEADPALATQVLRSNFEGPARLMEAFGSRFARRGSGTLIGVSSVAGLRGRASNYIYGSAKAGFTAYLSGLRNRMHPRGVHVMTVLPGFVATRMTAHLTLPSALTAQPPQVAGAVYVGFTKKRNTVYTLPVWRLIMLVIRAIPEPLFKRLSL
ncbi:MAG: SDR family oxidoreductase [Pseudomonadota bacterium]